jgi:hypothetical protein
MIAVTALHPLLRLISKHIPPKQPELLDNLSAIR